MDCTVSEVGGRYDKTGGDKESKVLSLHKFVG